MEKKEFFWFNRKQRIKSCAFIANDLMNETFVLSKTKACCENIPGVETLTC